MTLEMERIAHGYFGLIVLLAHWVT